MRQERPGKAGLARTSARRQGYIDMFNTTNIQEDLDAAWNQYKRAAPWGSLSVF